MEVVLLRPRISALLVERIAGLTERTGDEDMREGAETLSGEAVTVTEKQPQAEGEIQNGLSGGTEA